jgi:hypothetical protein
MASNIIKMVLKLDDKASPELKQVGQEAEKTTSKTTMLGKVSKVSAGQIAMMGTAAIGVVMSFKAMAQSYADSINQFGDASTITGAATETLETLAFMARGTNIEFSALTDGLVDFQKNLGELKQTDAGPLKQAFEAVGFDPSQYETTDETLRAFIERLQEVGDQATVSFAASRAFGGGMKTMMATLDVGKFEAYNAQMREFGFVATPEAVKQAQEMQKQTAIMGVMFERLKIRAFNAFGGPKGMAEGLAIGMAMLEGMRKFLASIVEGWKSVGRMMSAVASGLSAAAEGNIEGIQSSIEAFDEAKAKSLQVIAPYSYILGVKAAVEEYRSFKDTLADTSEESGLAAGSIGDIEDALKGLKGTASGTGTAVSEAVDEMAESVSGLKSAISDFTMAMWDVRGFDLSESIASASLFPGGKIDQQASQWSEYQIQEITRVIGVIATLSREAHGAAGMLTEVQNALLSDDSPNVIEDVARAYKRFAKLSEDGALEGFEADVQRIQGLRENLASLLIAQQRLLDLGGEAFAVEVDPFIESLKAAIEAAEEELRSGRIEFQASVDDQSLIDIRNSVAEGITLGAATVQSLAGGDVAGAAGGIATAAGASPMVSAVISALGAIAEIGQMTVKEIKQNTRAFVKNLKSGFDVLVKALPEIAKILLSDLPAVLIEASFTWIPLMVAQLPAAIMKGVVNGFKSIMSLLTDSIRNAFRVFDGGGIRGTPDGESSYVGPDTSYYTGSARVNRTGMALIHRNETIIPAGGRAAQDQHHRMGGASGITVNISTAVMDRDVIPRLVREIDRVVGTYGRTTAAFAGG